MTTHSYPIVDADAHVVESEGTWEHMAPADARFRPTIVTPRDDPKREYWLVDGKVPRPAREVMTVRDLQKLSDQVGRNLVTDQAARQMENVEVRLRHMDELGIDTQVLHNTIFIQQVTDRPDTERAICAGWNRWLADIWRRGAGRLRWSCMLPLMTMPEALEELEFCKEHGACAVTMRPVEGARLLHDPYFYPLYEEVSRLDMAIAVHIGNANPWLCELFRHPAASVAPFSRFRVPTASAVHDLVLSEVPLTFPSLRFAFIEAGAEWVPWVLTEVKRRIASIGRQCPQNILKEYRIYVTCENSDDLPYLIARGVEDSLLIGTDYGHTDPSSDIDAIRIFQQRDDITSEVKRKVLSDNPRRLYAL